MIGQIPDATAVVDKANSVSWEAGMLAVLIIAFMSVIVYMIKRQNDHADSERAATANREEAHQLRLSALESQIHDIQLANSEQLVGLVRDMIAAKVESNNVQAATRDTLADLTRTIGLVNGDIKEMCNLLRHNPCLLAGAARGAIKVTDSQGNVLNVERETETG